MTNSFRATDLPTTIDEVTARLQAANGSVLYALADLMTVFASHAELNGGDFVEIAGEKFQKLADLAGLPNVCADRARTWWRAVAEHRGLEHDGDYVLDTSSSASCQHYIDAYSRRVVGWSISDRITTEIVVDALEMARWRRLPEPGTVVHADRGAQYTSWLFGHRLRQAGLLGSMGRVASSVDNALIESFWSTMQRELLDRSTWASKAELASAIFEWIEAFYNPTRRHTALGNLSPVEFERLHTPAAQAA